MKILVINGANLDLLEKRDPVQYGTLSLYDIEKHLTDNFPEYQFIFFQSSLEGEIVSRLNKAVDEDIDAIIINPGGYAHTSVVIRDALDLVKKIKIEVHLSNLAAREPFRQILITASVCDGYISGLKQYGYVAAVEVIKKIKEDTVD